MCRHKCFRFLAALSILLAISTASSQAADSMEAVKKTISVLKDLKAQLKAKNDKNKVEAAIQELENLIQEDGRINGDILVYRN